MSTYSAGDSVTVEFMGIDHQGEVLWQSRGWTVCVIEPDPLADYGSITARLNPRTTVCVPDARVRPLT